MAVLDHDETLLRTMACPVPAAERPRLCGARRASAAPARPAGPVTVQRRVSSRGSIMVATQIDGETVATVPRTTSREIHSYKAYATQRASR